jgi:hypothetical protein
LLASDFKAGQLPAGERGAQGPPGPQGLPGAQGPPGQDATKLFAYIRDNGQANAATVHYGSGVIAVTDPGDDNTYTLTFDRSLVNRVVQAVAGKGNPAGPSTSLPATPFVSMRSGSADQVDVMFSTDAGMSVDTAFLVTAFC